MVIHPYRAAGVNPFDSASQLDLGDEVEKVTHAYTLILGDLDVRIIITIEPEAGTSDEYRLLLTMSTGTVERPIARPATMKLVSVHPKDLHFSVFAFPPKSSIPAGCLWSLRVWLNHGGIDHRIFSEERLWLGRNPDFYSILDARFARLQSITPISKTYKVPIGTSSIDMITSFKALGASTYQLSLKYEHDGVGRMLFDKIRVRLNCSPQDIHFIVYLIPVSSTPRGATHRMRVWMRSPAPPASLNGALDAHGHGHAQVGVQSSVYQRIWSLEEFKVGHSLDFTALGPRTVMGASIGAVSHFVSANEEPFFIHDEDRVTFPLANVGSASSDRAS